MPRIFMNAIYICAFFCRNVVKIAIQTKFKKSVSLSVEKKKEKTYLYL